MEPYVVTILLILAVILYNVVSIDSASFLAVADKDHRRLPLLPPPPLWRAQNTARALALQQRYKLSTIQSPQYRRPSDYALRTIATARRSVSVNSVLPPLPSITFQGIPGCKEIKCVGGGSYGQVYQVKLINLAVNQEAALKVFRGGSSASNDRSECILEQSILRTIAAYESRIGHQLQISHERRDIVGVQCPNLMLQYIPGSDISRVKLTTSMPVLVPFVLRMMKQIGLQVLIRLHSIHIYHNDLKPANILYDAPKDAFYLIDFGLAVPLDLLSRSEFNGMLFWTTLQYMSPFHVHIMHKSRQSTGYKIINNANTQQNAALADFYSLGMTAITMIAKHCRGLDPLCVMMRKIHSIQMRFAHGAEQQFTRWSIDKIRAFLLPSWRMIQNSINEYMKGHPLEYKEFMSLLADWMLINDAFLA